MAGFLLNLNITYGHINRTINLHTNIVENVSGKRIKCADFECFIPQMLRTFPRTNTLLFICIFLSGHFALIRTQLFCYYKQKPCLQITS